VCWIFTSGKEVKNAGEIFYSSPSWLYLLMRKSFSFGWGAARLVRVLGGLWDTLCAI